MVETILSQALISMEALGNIAWLVSAGLLVFFLYKFINTKEDRFVNLMKPMSVITTVALALFVASLTPEHLLVTGFLAPFLSIALQGVTLVLTIITIAMAIVHVLSILMPKLLE